MEGAIPDGSVSLWPIRPSPYRDYDGEADGAICRESQDGKDRRPHSVPGQDVRDEEERRSD
jgi:hypothetical protein